ncbi:hypothetical protein AQI95_24790 [Streptomyces yokosukanensis]|uniref:Uncharacterized protein n=1 Tax=Streptomyces yokosukanensis TaxID=67386 RepID=A0A117Q1K1_9ACTN|nr:hypothetical protein [Streptomyces yokosukanensis]KUN03176.1 hypothetical protein AQI95_24790 [Streptomyces yokosukanensis]
MTKPDQQLNLDAIETRATTATPGPWCTVGAEVFQGTEYTPDVSPWIGETCRASGGMGKADAEFIAHAREDVPRLVTEVRRLRAELATVTGQRDYWHGELMHADARITELGKAANCQSAAANNGDRCSLPIRHRGDHRTADKRHYWSDEYAAPAAAGSAAANEDGQQ